MKSNKGFTLIELLVVIAIIGILASIVLASLNTARDKGEDAAKKANLANARAEAELTYDTDGDYDDVCADPQIVDMMTSAGGTCTDSAAAWAAYATLSTTTGGNADTWCVDSTGVSAMFDTAQTGAVTAC